jgi:hypothetical protein
MSNKKSKESSGLKLKMAAILIHPVIIPGRM